MHKTIIHTIRDNSPHTKKDVEEFTALIDKGYHIMFVFEYKNEYYYIMEKHTHDEEEEIEKLKN